MDHFSDVGGMPLTPIIGMLPLDFELCWRVRL